VDDFSLNHDPCHAVSFQLGKIASIRFDSSLLLAGRHRPVPYSTLHPILRSKNANSGVSALDSSMKAIDAAVRRLYLAM
jgi:hypothetical protein